MGRKLRAENPGLTAGSICECILFYLIIYMRLLTVVAQIVASMWRTEKGTVKAHFHGLAKKEEERHKLMYPDYRYEARRPSGAVPRRSGFNFMHPAQRLIFTGFYKK